MMVSALTSSRVPLVLLQELKENLITLLAPQGLAFCWLGIRLVTPLSALSSRSEMLAGPRRRLAHTVEPERSIVISRFQVVGLEVPVCQVLQSFASMKPGVRVAFSRQLCVVVL